MANKHPDIFNKVQEGLGYGLGGFGGIDEPFGSVGDEIVTIVGPPDKPTLPDVGGRPGGRIVGAARSEYNHECCGPVRVSIGGPPIAKTRPGVPASVSTGDERGKDIYGNEIF